MCSLVLFRGKFSWLQIDHNPTSQCLKRFQKLMDIEQHQHQYQHQGPPPRLPLPNRPHVVRWLSSLLIIINLSSC